MAVTFVLGNAHELSASLLMPSNSIAARSPTSSPKPTPTCDRSSLIALAFLLFVVTFIVADRGPVMLARIGRTHGRTPLMLLRRRLA